MTRDELLDALLVERYDNRWWTGKQPKPEHDDSELTTARRLRDAVADFERAEKEKAS